MPLRADIKKVLVIGSGPIVIGQAAEFDYAGTQACRALKEEGLEVVLVNSNPATIMTDKAMADKIYIEPLNLDVVKRIIEMEQPDSVLSTLGGQTGLTLSMQLAKEGFLVLPYMYPDLNVARSLQDAGAAAVMPLAAPIGSNKGLLTKEFIQILVDEIDLPVIVDAGIGRPSQACEAMELGVDAIMANTAIATAGNVKQMAAAFRLAIEAGRQAYLSGLGRVLEGCAEASSPLTGFLEA